MTLTIFLIRVYIEEERLTSAAKTQLIAATLKPYNTSIFLGDIKTEGAKSNAKIWVSLWCSLYNFYLRCQSPWHDKAKFDVRTNHVGRKYLSNAKYLFLIMRNSLQHLNRCVFIFRCVHKNVDFNFNLLDKTMPFTVTIRQSKNLHLSSPKTNWKSK